MEVKEYTFIFLDEKQRKEQWKKKGKSKIKDFAFPTVCLLFFWMRVLINFF